IDYLIANPERIRGTLSSNPTARVMALLKDYPHHIVLWRLSRNPHPDAIHLILAYLDTHPEELQFDFWKHNSDRVYGYRPADFDYLDYHRRECYETEIKEADPPYSDYTIIDHFDWCALSAEP